jgi:hypothetical protein
MASITVKVTAEEIDELFLKNIRALFKNGKVRITFESDDTAALGQLENILNQRVREGATYSVPGDTFDQLLQVAESDDNFDVVAELKKHKKQ